MEMLAQRIRRANYRIIVYLLRDITSNVRFKRQNFATSKDYSGGSLS